MDHAPENITQVAKDIFTFPLIVKIGLKQVFVAS